jgi:hypothetical protein
MSPVYDFSCDNGHHYTRRVASFDDREQVCPIGRCFAPAKAHSVYPFNHTHPRYWGGELPASVERARDEYLLSATEAKAAIAEEQANGWSG